MPTSVRAGLVRAHDHGVDTCLDCADLRDAYFDCGEGDGH